MEKLNVLYPEETRPQDEEKVFWEREHIILRAPRRAVN